MKTVSWNVNIISTGISGNIVHTSGVLNWNISNSHNSNIRQKEKESIEEERKVIINLYNKLKTINPSLGISFLTEMRYYIKSRQIWQTFRCAILQFSYDIDISSWNDWYNDW